MATNLPPSVPPKNLKESTWQAMMYDEIIEDIHAHRAAVSDRFGGDLGAMLEYYESLDVPLPVSKVKPQVRRVPVSG